MKKKVMACLVSASMLLTMLSPVAGTFAADPATPSDVTGAQVTETVSATEETTLPTDALAAEITETPAVTPAPSVEQTAEPAVTEESTVAPTEESTIVPEETPVAEETAEPTADPSVDPSVEPSAEPTVEPTEEPTEEPTATPAVPESPLMAGVTLDKTYAFANEDGVIATVSISGGFAPYDVTLKVMANGNTYEQSTAGLEAGSLALYYAPVEYGVHTFEVTVTDASGATYVTAASLPVAIRRDVEYASDWESTVKGVKLTGDWRKDLIAIAETQLGYQESEYNFEIDENGKQQGFTRYGAWYGAAYSDWCGMFVAFCLNYAEIPEASVPRDAHCEILKQKMNSLGAYEEDEDAYEPKPGDLVFFAFEQKSVPDHVGIVVSVSGNTIETIEGNSNKAVRRNSYSRSDANIVGYANMETLMRRAGKLEETAEPEVTAAPETTVAPEATPETTEAPVTEAPVMKESEDGDTEITIADIEGVIVLTQPASYAWQQGSTTLTFTVQNAVSYQWQYALYTDGEPAWSDVPGGDASELSVSMEVDSAKYMYRCTATAANGISVLSNEVTLVTPELIRWINEGSVTMDMLNRAMSAKSIDSMTLENDTLVYVRNGKVYARYDSATGAVTDEETGLVVAYMDAQTGMMYPVSAGE